MSLHTWHIGDRVKLHGPSQVEGTISSVSALGHLGVRWDDGDETPPGGIHRDDIEVAGDRKEER